jgi:hypothetical protein
VELGEHRLDVIELMRYLEALRLDSKKFFCDYCNAGLGGKSPEIGRKSLKFSGKKFWPTVKILDLAGKNLQPIQLIFD